MEGSRRLLLNADGCGSLLIMDSQAWVAYFDANARREEAHADDWQLRLPEPLWRALLESLKRLQIGEAEGGSIVQQVHDSEDPALDLATRQAIALYIAEEHRHARELSVMIHALGSQPLRQQWVASLFRHGRRLFGLRAKLLALAAAETVGVEYYRILSRRVPNARIRRITLVIAEEEAEHLRFVSDWIQHSLRRAPVPGHLYPWILRTWLCHIRIASIGVFLFDHRQLLSALDIGPVEFATRCWDAGSPLGAAFAPDFQALGPSSNKAPQTRQSRQVA